MSIEGADATMIKVRGIEESLKRDIVEAISEGAREAETVLAAGAPEGQTGRLRRSVKNDGVSFHPGGLGGGGFWEAEVSVGEGVPYLRHVVEGTGIHAGKGNISPTSKSMMHWNDGKLWGNPLTALKGSRFTQGGISHWAHSTQGQKPNDKWIRAAQVAANEVMERNLREIDSRHDA
jgi:hypothetical protein